MDIIKEIIQKQQAYELRKTVDYPACHSIVESNFPLLEQNIILMQKTKKKQKRKQVLKIIITILLSILCIILELATMISFSVPENY
ncbi:MAG: hypothetical protein K2K70_06600 [Lachnospiraceae bacterium]|nr:hypothetical protein [Lachnospiraceae bacterium]